MKFFEHLHSFIVDEKDVTTVLTTLNRNRHNCQYRIGNCGWGGPDEQKKKWFIYFNSTNKCYGRIVRDLQKIGKLDVMVLPAGIVELYFTKD